MRKMRIDFAAPGWRRGWYRLHPAVLGAGLLGLALCAGAALYGDKTAQRQRRHDAALSEAARRQQGRRSLDWQAAARQAERARLPEAQVRAVNDAVLQLNLPWRDLREAVDAVAGAAPASVALLALEPDPARQTLKIGAEAKSADDMMAFVERLQQQEFFSGAALQRHEFNSQDGTVRFQVQAQWGAR